MFFKNKTDDYVDLSIGRVYFKPLTNGLINKAGIFSTIGGDIINNALYFSIIEYGLIHLSKRKVNNLSIKDGDKVRDKVKEILSRHGLLVIDKETTTENKWDKNDVNWFNKSLDDSLQDIKRATIPSPRE